MRYLELKEQLKEYKIFNLRDVRKLEAGFDLRRLNEWQSKGYLIKIRQGWYAFADLEITEPILFTIANRIHGPSYVSLEIALSLYGLIPESVYTITSVTSGQTLTLETPLGAFSYRHLKPELLFGYSLREYKGQTYKIAEAEKAVLDYFYLNPDVADKESFEGLRLNPLEFKERIKREMLSQYLTAFGSQALASRINKLLTYVDHA